MKKVLDPPQDGPAPTEPRSVMAAKPGNQPRRDVEPWNVPIFYGSSFGACRAGNDFVITIGRPHPGSAANMPGTQPLTVNEPVAVVQLSPGSLKDLCLILETQIGLFEKEFGTIETDFTRRRGCLRSFPTNQ